MALSNRFVTAFVIMLDAVPELTGRLDIHTVPVIFVEQRRVDGDQNEWLLAEQVRQAGQTQQTALGAGHHSGRHDLE